MTKKQNFSILVINCGSSSLKFSLYGAASLLPEWSGSVNHIGGEESKLEIRNSQHQLQECRVGNFKNLDAAVKEVIDWLKSNPDQIKLSAIGHRLVQGGPEHQLPELITGALLKTLERFVYLAPNHLPDELKAVKAFQVAFPKLPQVACFDTAFHKDMPSYARYYPLPEKYKDMGLIKYGFHGLSYQYILQALTAEDPEVTKKKIIIAHLGNGASMAAIKNGISVDTTMGLSPVGGLVMGTRSGDLDPGVLLFLLKQGKLGTAQLDKLLSKDSGLKAIAGMSDIQELLEAEPENPKAKEALIVFCYAAKKFIGALAAAMGGLDLLVFTGGIGENSAIIRERICSDLEFIGIDATDQKSRVTVRVIPTNEALMIARMTCDLLNDKK
ncbi:MAG: acetate/propionate family kinase [Bacteroidota bacterium]